MNLQNRKNENSVFELYEKNLYKNEIKQNFCFQKYFFLVRVFILKCGKSDKSDIMFDDTRTYLSDIMTLRSLNE